MSSVSCTAKWVRVALCAGVIAAGDAAAVPMLQLYIEGATYDSNTESWYVAGHDFRLWAIGNLSKSGGSDGASIEGVRLSAVYDDPGSPVSITITPTKIGGAGAYGGFTDATAPGTPTLIQIVADGSVPLIGGDRFLPAHGEYGAGKIWQEFALGSFDAADSQLADFVSTFPVPGADLAAQVNAYDVHVEGADAHFDLYGWVTDKRGRKSYVFAPPSHDASDGPASVPVPATLALLGIGGLGIARFRRRPAANPKSELSQVST